MRILAIHSGVHDSSAAAFDDYNLLAAVQQERLIRHKGWGAEIPWLAIDEVLRTAGWIRTDVDAIAFVRGYFPTQYFRFPLANELHYAWQRQFGRERTKRDIADLCRRFGIEDSLTLFRADRFLAENGFRAGLPVRFVNHHEAHALAALFFTDWDDALIYTSDGVGDNVSYSMRALKAGKLECFYGDDRWFLPDEPCAGLAYAYAFATEACGFRRLRHEGKLTGLAAYGEPAIAPALASCFEFGKNGLISAPFKTWDEMGERIKMICRGHPRETIAASIQKVIEDLTAQSVLYWLKQTGARRLALAGGLFANVRLNRLLAETMPIEEIFILPPMGDDGLSVGSGLATLLARDGLATWLTKRRRLDNVYLGQNYDDRIDACLEQTSGVRRHGGTPIELATDMVRQGKAGAVYSGRMEFGPRALGARSIIASPSDATINDTLNKRLERSEFMPFAPYVLEEDAERVFEITPINRYTAHFMTITCAVKPEWLARIPAVVHVDGTARPQILRESENPLFGGILRRFRDATGLPVLINTSFNVHEEPIVNRPQECRKALVDGRVDFVVTNRAVYTLG
jgi:carbamoyltransferase